MKINGVIFAIALLCGCYQGHAAAWEVELDPRPQDYFEHVTYRLWLPDGLKRARALIVLHHGCGVTGGLLHASDVQYRALATKWQIGLLAAAEWQSDATCQYWVHVERGSAHAFLSALNLLAARSDHPEIATVPWALWGHSGGAAWVVAMTAKFPERVIATFARSGAFAPLDDVTGPGPMTMPISAAMRRVPITFCYGAKEELPDNVMTHFTAHVREVYNLGGTQSRWSLAIDPIAGHENGDTRYLTFRFFDTVFAQTAALGGGTAADVWHGDPRSLDIAPAGAIARPSGDVALAWLPGEPFSRAWQEFGRTGEIRDTTPPPSPSAVVVRAIANGVVISWRAEADIESGIKEFRVYGDGELLGRVASVHGEYVKEDFHNWNYTDRPAADQTDNAMRFAWRGKPHSALTVTTINHWGLESARSAPAAGSTP
jgi:pimeloyl-ACP methyl ester carboxylesterase